MSPESVVLVESTFQALRPQGPLLVERFYEALFARHPEVRPMFRADMQPQRAALLGALDLAVGNLRNPDALVPALEALGRRHAGYGVQSAHYGVVRDVLLDVLAELAGDAWTDEVQGAWRQTLDLVGTVMLRGAEA